MKRVAVLLVTFAVLNGALAHDWIHPAARVPIIVGDNGHRLDTIKIPRIAFKEVATLEAYSQLLDLVNKHTGEELPPFKMAFSLATVSKWPATITLELENADAILALQYITALTGNHFSVHQDTIIVLPEAEAT